MDPNPNSADFIVPPYLMCGCGEPMKLNRDKRVPPVSCPKCRSEMSFDNPEEFNAVVELLYQYWVSCGRPDYAGVE
jgi:hypothetical protein